MKRNDYLEKRITYEEYYQAIAKRLKNAGIIPPEDIKSDSVLKAYEIWACSLLTITNSYIKMIFKEFDDQVSIAGLICALKELVKMEEQHD